MKKEKGSDHRISKFHIVLNHYAPKRQSCRAYSLNEPEAIAEGIRRLAQLIERQSAKALPARAGA